MGRWATGLGLLLIAELAYAAQAPVVRFVDFENTVLPWTALRITRAIDEAEAAGDSAVLIQLDTPGGLVDSMDTIVKRMLNARVPIIVWVGPSGSRAASAGFFILMAADVAAMAPGTRSGAAAGLVLGGEEGENDVAALKLNEDLAALVRSIAERRGRDVEAAEQAVREARSYEETAALEAGLIDLIASSTEELLERLDGREIRRFDGGKVVLATRDAKLVVTEFSLRHELLESLGHPTVAYLLLVIGALGLLAEFNHPGLIFPGAIGVLSLLLFAVGARGLPLNVLGVILVLLALALFVLEVKIVSHGMLALGGLACLVVGSLMLFGGGEPLEQIPELRVPLGLILPVSLAVAGLCVVALRLAVDAQRAAVDTGVEGLAGETGTVTEGLAPEGRVFVHGEIWNAVSRDASSLPKGTRVRVLAVEDLKLVVESADDHAAAERS